MDAKSLRIGNWVKGAFDCERQVTASNILNCFHGAGDLEPIPLTEDWLTRFGFEDSEPFANYGVEIDFSGNPSSLCLTKQKDKDGEFYEIEIYQNKQSLFLNYIEHVHQLQNLYFALTGEELTIDENSQQ